MLWAVAEHAWLRQGPLGRPQPRLTQSPGCWGNNDSLSSSLHPTPSSRLQGQVLRAAILGFDVQTEAPRGQVPAKENWGSAAMNLRGWILLTHLGYQGQAPGARTVLPTWNSHLMGAAANRSGSPGTDATTENQNLRTEGSRIGQEAMWGAEFPLVKNLRLGVWLRGSQETVIKLLA
ncbi:uncharacterized protein LOC129054964 isoform X2 [Pongo abelii]|uniref:uncharacterized protein LOC129054964 isoform X2 n=1 Tax=Pongo abelii TaxID=9601 RepID=UPI0023E7B1F3|nr:uncharacterized protein LOC129054964 isoform X2 [Pongo abelii]